MDRKYNITTNNFNYPIGSINYNLVENAVKYKENMNGLRNSK